MRKVYSTLFSVMLLFVLGWNPPVAYSDSATSTTSAIKLKLNSDRNKTGDLIMLKAGESVVLTGTVDTAGSNWKPVLKGVDEDYLRCESISSASPDRQAQWRCTALSWGSGSVSHISFFIDHAPNYISNMIRVGTSATFGQPVRKTDIDQAYCRTIKTKFFEEGNWTARFGDTEIPTKCKEKYYDGEWNAINPFALLLRERESYTNVSDNQLTLQYCRKVKQRFFDEGNWTGRFGSTEAPKKCKEKYYDESWNELNPFITMILDSQVRQAQRTDESTLYQNIPDHQLTLDYCRTVVTRFLDEGNWSARFGDTEVPERCQRRYYDNEWNELAEPNVKKYSVDMSCVADRDGIHVSWESKEDTDGRILDTAMIMVRKDGSTWSGGVAEMLKNNHPFAYFENEQYRQISFNGITINTNASGSYYVAFPTEAGKTYYCGLAGADVESSAIYQTTAPERKVAPKYTVALRCTADQDGIRVSWNRREDPYGHHDLSTSVIMVRKDGSTWTGGTSEVAEKRYPIDYDMDDVYQVIDFRNINVNKQDSGSHFVPFTTKPKQKYYCAYAGASEDYTSRGATISYTTAPAEKEREDIGELFARRLMHARTDLTRDYCRTVKQRFVDEGDWTTRYGGDAEKAYACQDLYYDEHWNEIGLDNPFLALIKAAPAATLQDPVIAHPSAYQNPFADTDANTLEGKAGIELERRAIISGYEDGEFKGDRPVTRAEAAKFLLQAKYGSVDEVSDETIFPDVMPDTWYAKFVTAAAQEGIISGYPDGFFRPSNTVRTAEFLKMLTKTFGLKTYERYSYTDVNPSAWYAPYAGVAEKYNLLPDRESQLYPKKNLTRKEVAVAIYQYLSNR